MIHPPPRYRPSIGVRSSPSPGGNMSRICLACLAVDIDHADPMASVLRAFPHLEALTERECEILTGMAGGASDRDVAERMQITVRTAKWHLANIRKKLGGLNRLQLCLLAAVFHLHRLASSGDGRRPRPQSHACERVIPGADDQELVPLTGNWSGGLINPLQQSGLLTSSRNGPLSAMAEKALLAAGTRPPWSHPGASGRSIALADTGSAASQDAPAHPRTPVRTFGKRVRGNLSRVRISYPPPVPHRA
ncbi:helix-turn-helix transcriptional regulator [Streptomyces sp. NPDC019443]|uniref:helix-turn-helix transcriptional regulator n=1 Tax=Streptomyces sp. NPDC019443 TaxID=3365061 RepID=UPI0037894E02